VVQLTVEHLTSTAELTQKAVDKHQVVLLVPFTEHLNVRNPNNLTVWQARNVTKTYAVARSQVCQHFCV